MNKFAGICALLVIIGIILGLAVFPFLPESVPIHWNATGEVDGYGPAWMGAFLFPAIMLFVLFLLWIIPKIEVFKENLKSFEKQYWILGTVLELFFLILFAVTVLPNFGFLINFSQAFVVPFAFLFIAIGWLMPSFKRNFFVGIKTPWTIANDKVWEKTHSIGGKLFILAGIIALLSALIPEYSFLISITAIIAAAIIPIIYSFILYRKIGENQL